MSSELTSRPSMRVAMPAAVSAGGGQGTKAPSSGCRQSYDVVFQELKVSPCMFKVALNFFHNRGGRSYFCWRFIGVNKCRRQWPIERRPTGRVRDDWHLVSVAHSNNRMQLHVASTIMHLHPVCDDTGCPSGMECDATRILWSQCRFQGQGTCFRQVLVQVYLERPDTTKVTTRGWTT